MKPFDNGQKVTTIQQAFRDDFGGSATTSPAINSNWQVTNSAAATSTAAVATSATSGAASGMTVQIDGSSNLKITSGTTASQTTFIQSTQTYTIPCRVTFNFVQSARVANTDLYLELVNAAGDMVAGMYWLGSNGSGQSGNIYTVNSSSANTNGVTMSSTLISDLWSIDVFPDECFFSSKSINTTAPVNAFTQSINQKLPDPQQQYYVRVRVTNQSTSPASSSTITIDAISVQDITPMAVEITGGRGSTAGSQAVPMYLTGAAAAYTQAVSGGVTSYGQTLYSTGLSTNATLGSSATWTSGAVTLSNYYAKIRATAWSDQAGTLYVDVSYNSGTNWYSYTQNGSVVSQAIPSGGGYIALDVPTNDKAGSLVAPQFRARFVNGTTAQTVFYADINQLGM